MPVQYLPVTSPNHRHTSAPTLGGLKNAPDGRRQTGLLKPNDWGLFDVYGNVVEFCSHSDNVVESTDDREPPRDRLPVLQWDEFSQGNIPLRGGSHRDSAWSMRSAYRTSAHSYTVWETGFRPVRTLLATESEFTPPELELAIPVQIDPSLYEDYVGNYQFPGDRIFFIAKQDDCLFAQLTGNPKFALTAMSENRFFAKEVPGDIEFVRSDDGPVVHLIHRFFGEREIVARRTR